MNFGRTPSLLDFDITVSYPPFPGDTTYALPAINLDFSRVQGKLYQRLYSGQAQRAKSEVRSKSVWEIASELNSLLDRLKVRPTAVEFARDLSIEQLVEEKAPEDLREFLQDPVKMSEMLININLTLAYKQLPTAEPSHPFRFAEQCVAAARKSLELHQNLSSTFLSRTSLSFRMYIEW